MSFLRRLSKAAKTGPEEKDLILDLEGQEITLILRKHPKARRIKLTIDPTRGQPVLTMPPGVSEREALSFVHKNAGWTLAALDRLPEQRSFAPDAVIPFRGIDHRIDHRPQARGIVFVENDLLVVTGEEARLPRRLTDFCRKQARAEIKPLALEKAKELGRKPGRIILRDQRTRWGSCAASGDLSFSWRLILAPPKVLDYVVCHEVAHLVHMDHSPAFWRTVEQICPDWKISRDWLSDNGAQLHRVG